MTADRSQWFDVTAHMSDAAPVRLGPRLLGWLSTDPTLLNAYLDRYKFAAKMIGRGRRVLDADCGEAFGSWVLAKECGPVTGFDPDALAIELARGNWGTSGLRLVAGDWRTQGDATYDACVWFQPPDAALNGEVSSATVDAATRLLAPDGVWLVGGPVDAAGGALVETQLRQRFAFVFPFTMPGSGFSAGAARAPTYGVWLACKKRER